MKHVTSGIYSFFVFSEGLKHKVVYCLKCYEDYLVIFLEWNMCENLQHNYATKGKEPYECAYYHTCIYM